MELPLVLLVKAGNISNSYDSDISFWIEAMDSAMSSFFPSIDILIRVL
jgi:hypothetical protein